MPKSTSKKEHNQFLLQLGKAIKVHLDETTSGTPIQARISFGQLADYLKEKNITTVKGNNWTRHSLKLAVEELADKGFELDVGHKENKTSRANEKRTKLADEHAQKTYEKYLKDIDIGSMSLNQLARELNRLGSRTIKQNKWSAAGVKYLLKRLRKLQL